jgi:hypothetical protein
LSLKLAIGALALTIVNGLVAVQHSIRLNFK